MTRVYVGGALGDIPVVAEWTVEAAICGLLRVYVHANVDEDGSDEQWICRFVDGETGGPLRYTLTVQVKDREYRLYIEAFDVEGTSPC